MKEIEIELVIFLLIILCSCTTIKTSQEIIPKNNLIYSAPYDKVYNCSINALMALGWQITHSNKDEGLIQAKAPMSLWTWGDLITVHIIKEFPDKVRVDVTSGSPQQFDWGKNKKNIEAFYEELKKQLED